MKQRIAVVAVSALTAGLFSVVSAPASNAAAGTTAVGPVNLSANANTNPGITHYDTLYVATAASSTGAGIAKTADAVAPDVAAATGTGATAAARSLGLVNVSDIAGGLTAGTTQTAVLLSTGRLSVFATAKAGEYSSFTVTGGTFSSSTGTSMNAGATIVAMGGAGIVGGGVVAAPSSGSTQMIVRLYSGQGSLAAAQNTPTSGTLTGQITVTVASTSTAGIISATNSAVYGAVSATDTNQTADATATEGFLASRTYGTPIFFNVRVLDAFGTAINSGTAGIFQVSATNGAIVGAHASSAPAGTASTAYLSTATPDNSMIRVDAPGTAPVTTTVTVSFNGTVIGTRTVVFTGEVAKITLSSPVIGALGVSAGNSVGYRLTDAAGNAIYSTIGTTAITNYTISALIGDGSLSTAIGAIVRDTAPSIDANGVIAASDVLFTCPAAAASGTVALTYTNPSGTIIKSNVQAVKCAGSALGYTASWDKASYIPGDIAKLTVSFKDSKGNAANDVDAIATTLPVVSIGGLDKTVTGPTTADVPDQGSVVYTYTVGATPGAFSGTVKFATVDARYAAATGLTAPGVTTTLTVKEATTSVSNADVLKSIVALIASINKQIQALQKLILRR
jgi:hypothetical protein